MAFRSMISNGAAQFGAGRRRREAEEAAPARPGPGGVKGGAYAATPRSVLSCTPREPRRTIP